MSLVTLRFAEQAPHQLLVIPALFEEANRMRRFTVQLMRGLGEHGIGTTLIDLPGQGEDARDLRTTSFADWQHAVDATASTLAHAHPLATLAIRGGALLDGKAAKRWRLAPERGARLMRDLVRATALTSDQTAAHLDATARENPTRLAGNLLSPALYVALLEAEPKGEARETQLPGKKLWRSAEPDEDAELLAAALYDVKAWLLADA